MKTQEKKQAKRHVYNQHGDCIECGMLAVQGDRSYCPALVNKYIDSKLTSEGQA